MRKLITALLAAMSILSSAAFDRKQVETALNTLDSELRWRNSYITARQHHIDSLCNENRRLGNQPDLLMKIADAYTSFNNDSAIVYLRRGSETASGAEKLPFKWKLASLLPLGGFFSKAEALYDSIQPSDLTQDQLLSYYNAGRQMHSYIASFFESYPEVYRPHEKKASEYQHKMLDLLPQRSPERLFNLGEYYFVTGRHDMAQVILEEIVASEPPESNLRARAAHHLSEIAGGHNDEAARIYYLAISATADILSATREVKSLQELGQTVYSSGDIGRAHRYLSVALANAVECGAPLRMIDSSKSLPIIEYAYLANNSRWERTMYWILAAMIVLVISLIASMLVLRHEMRNMRRLQSSLRVANSAKELYIGQFLQLCSIYMDKLNQFCKIATRKIAAGQADEFYRMVKSGKFIEEQSREFYEVFDNAFLHMYPNFVSQVNALLKPDCRITIAPGELLDTDLRILAFMRLGIEESARIAQVLNYSLNTIYAYRNRLKGRAIDRENFEAAVMKIPSGL